MKNFTGIKHLKMAVALIVTGFIFTAGLWAKDVPPEKAKQVAKNFIIQHFTSDSLMPAIPNDLHLSFTQQSISTQVSQDAPTLPLYYVFDFSSETGFIIVSADDRALPVLGYSTESDFDPEQLHPEIRKWLESYVNQLRYIIQQDLPASPEVQQQWEALEKDQRIKAFSATNSVAPLIKTKWNQSPYYNDLCPYDSKYGKRTVTGCTATAMAQIMKYWNHPAQGSGFHSFNHENYGTLSANFGGTTYDWNQMPNEVNSTNNAVAKLMFHCGVAIESVYGPTLTLAYMISNYSPSVEKALKNYFGYDPNLKGKTRSDYSDGNWISMLQEELNSGRPVPYRGSGSGGGHAFICDGYNGNYFHMNWGWGGNYDGFFLLNNLNPNGVGTGGGSGRFNNGQKAIFGVKPLYTGSEDLELAFYDYLTANPNPVNYGGGFTVHMNVANFGESSFQGDFCVTLFDKDINFVDFVEIKTNWSLRANSHYTNGITFESQGSLSFLPGSYTLAAFYRPTGENWTLLSNRGNFQNLTSFKIEHSNDIELYAEIDLSTGSNLTQYQAFDVHLDIANAGDSDFNGILSISLFDLEGKFVETIDAIDNVSLRSGYYLGDGLDFSTQGIEAEPGTYLLALMFKPDGQDWELAGSTYQTNPIHVIVKVAPIPADPYENNNSRSEAYIFQPYFSNDRYAFDTEGSSMHNSEDYDFYGLNLQGGYTYYVTGRLHDSYSSTNGKTYTNDCLVSLLLDDYTSSVYDDVLPNFTITMNATGNVIFHVSPYFEGKKGTYLLDIQVRREYGTGIDEFELLPELSIYPNPAENVLNIRLKDFNDPIYCLEIIDLQGKLILREEKDYITNENIHLDIRHIPKGIYTIRLIGKKLHQAQFIKGK